MLIKLWKLLPEKLINLSSIHTFKNQIRKSERKSLLVDCCQNHSSLCWILWLLSVMNINYSRITLVQLVQNNGVHITFEFLLFILMFKNCKKILDLNFECCKQLLNLNFQVSIISRGFHPGLFYLDTLIKLLIVWVFIRLFEIRLLSFFFR